MGSIENIQKKTLKSTTLILFDNYLESIMSELVLQTNSNCQFESKLFRMRDTTKLVFMIYC